MAPCPADSCDTSTGETCRSPMSACPCGTGIQTPEHIFQDCPTHRDVRKSNLARGSASSGEAIGISSSVEKDCRFHRQDWTDDLSMAWKRRERSGPHLPKKHNKKTTVSYQCTTVVYTPPTSACLRRFRPVEENDQFHNYDWDFRYPRASCHLSGTDLMPHVRTRPINRQ